LTDDIQKDPTNYKIGENLASDFISSIEKKDLNTLSGYKITNEELFTYNPTIKKTVDKYNTARDKTLEELKDKNKKNETLDKLISSC